MGRLIVWIWLVSLLFHWVDWSFDLDLLSFFIIYLGWLVVWLGSLPQTLADSSYGLTCCHSFTFKFGSTRRSELVLIASPSLFEFVINLFGRPTSIQTDWPFGGSANNNFSQIGWPFRLDIAKRFLSLTSIDWPFCTWHSHNNSLILVIDFGCTFAARWQWWFSLSLGQLWEKSVEPICFLFFEFGSIWQVRLNV